jgi:hypothetical protein
MLNDDTGNYNCCTSETTADFSTHQFNAYGRSSSVIWGRNRYVSPKSGESEITERISAPSHYVMSEIIHYDSQQPFGRAHTTACAH